MPASPPRDHSRRGTRDLSLLEPCCRRAYLLGKDPLTGKNHNHRREWVCERLQLLVANFVVDVCFLSVLAKHLHAVLRSTPRLAQRMGSWEVARRWLRVFPGRRVLDGPWIEPTEEQVQTLAADKEKIKIQLLDWCGREIQGDKRGAIPATLPPILERLGVVEEELIETVRDFPRCFRRLAESDPMCGCLSPRIVEDRRMWAANGSQAIASRFRSVSLTIQFGEYLTQRQRESGQHLAAGQRITRAVLGVFIRRRVDHRTSLARIDHPNERHAGLKVLAPFRSISRSGWRC